MLLSEQKSKNNNNTKKQSRKVKEILASLVFKIIFSCTVASFSMQLLFFRSFQEVSLHLMCAGEDKKTNTQIYKICTVDMIPSYKTCTLF